MQFFYLIAIAMNASSHYLSYVLHEAICTNGKKILEDVC